MTGLEKTAPVPFFWSLRRERMYRRCLRELFLDSFGGRGGHEWWSEPDRRRIHHLKQRRTIPAFCRDLLAESLRQGFLTEGGEEEFPESFDRRFWRILQQLWKRRRQEILLGDPEIDHRIPFFAEPEAAQNYEWLFHKVDTELRQLTETGFWQDLLAEIGAVPPLDRLIIPAPFTVQLAELTVYTATLLAWRRGSRVVFLSLIRGPDADRDEVYRVIEQYFSWNHLKIPPERVDSILVDPGQPARYDYCGAVVSPAVVMDRILTSATEVALRLDRDGKADPAAFPMAAECPPECRFYPFCH